MCQVKVKPAKLCTGRGGGGRRDPAGARVQSGGVKEERSCPVTLSMKTEETVFTKLIGGEGGRCSEVGLGLNLLTLEPLPLSYLHQPPSLSSQPYLTQDLSPSPPSPHIGTKCNLSKQQANDCVGRQSSLSPSFSSPSSSDVDMMAE